MEFIQITVTIITFLVLFQNRGHNLTRLGSSIYEEDVTGRLLQIASVLEGLSLVEKKIFRVANFEFITHCYKGPSILKQMQEQEFNLNKKRYNLKKLRIRLKKVRVDSILFLPFLQRETKINHRLKSL